MPKPRPPCGTEGGYNAHLRRKEPTCAGCRKAHRRDTKVKRVREVTRILHGRPVPPRVHRPCGTAAATRRHAREGLRWQDCPACAAAAPSRVADATGRLRWPA